MEYQMRFTEPIYRPPMEAKAMLLQATQSCNWNKCNFCYRSKDYPFLAAKPEELEEQILAQKPFFVPETPIFLVGSNTFALPARKLKAYLDVINKHFPNHGRLSMFSRVDAIAAKSDEELADLRKAGLTQLYVGTENGNNQALALMNKGHTAEEAIKQLKRLENANIDYVAFYILGMGGKGTGQQTALDTAAMFNQLKPRRITSTGMTTTEGTGAATLRAEGKFTDAPEREKIEELRTFLENLTIDTYYDGLHYLNPVHYRLKNSDKTTKAEVLADIDRILENYSDAEIERAVNRPEMEEACKPEHAR